MSQLQLLNTTVQSLALAVNRVLSACYHAVYPSAQEGDELVLLTAPLSAVTEIQALFDSKIIDIDSALPAALHSLGSSAIEIKGALKRRRDELDASTERENAQLDASVEQTRAGTEQTKANTDLARANIDQTKANIDKTKADTSLAKKQAAAPVAAAGASSKN